LPKGRIGEIANSKNALPLVTSALAVAERNFDIAITVDRIGPNAKASFPRTNQIGSTLGAVPEIHQQYRVSKY